MYQRRTGRNRHAATEDTILHAANRLRHAANRFADHYSDGQGNFFWSKRTIHRLRADLWNITNIIDSLRQPIGQCFGSNSPLMHRLSDLDNQVHIWQLRPSEFKNERTLAADANDLQLIVDTAKRFADSLEEEVEALLS